MSGSKDNVHNMGRKLERLFSKSKRLRANAGSASQGRDQLNTVSSPGINNQQSGVTTHDTNLISVSTSSNSTTASQPHVSDHGRRSLNQANAQIPSQPVLPVHNSHTEDVVVGQEEGDEEESRMSLWEQAEVQSRKEKPEWVCVSPPRTDH